MPQQTQQNMPTSRQMKAFGTALTKLTNQWNSFGSGTGSGSGSGSGSSSGGRSQQSATRRKASTARSQSGQKRKSQGRKVAVT